MSFNSVIQFGGDYNRYGTDLTITDMELIESRCISFLMYTFEVQTRHPNIPSYTYY